MRLPFRKQSSGSPSAGGPSQLQQAYQLTKEVDPSVTYWCAAAFLIPFVVLVVLAFTTGPLVPLLVLALLVGTLAAVVTLGLRARKALFSRIEGQEGAAGAALSTIRKGFVVEEQPVAVDTRTHDMVFRAIGRAGVVLVTEGPTTRVRKLVDGEKKRIARVAPSAPIHVFHTGDEEGQVPVRKIATKLQRLKPELSREEADDVAKRLKSLGGMRPPIPKGIDPNRMGVSARRVRRR